MARKKHTAEQIIRNLREAEVALAEEQTVVKVSRTLGITEQIYYRRRQEYGGLKVDQAKWLKEPEQENTRLKRAVASLPRKRCGSGQLRRSSSLGRCAHD